MGSSNTLITFDPNDGTLTSNVMSVTYRSSYTLPIPTFHGYTFTGWYLESGEQLSDGVWALEENLSVTATWIISTFNIDYDLNGGNPKTFFKNALHGF